MSAQRRHGRHRKVVLEVARFWTVPAYVAFGLLLAHFDTSASWWAVVLLTLSVGTLAIAGAWIALALAVTAGHSLWRSYGVTYPPDWLSRLASKPEGYENYERWTRDKWFSRLRDDVRKLSPDERAEILTMLREASNERAAMLSAMLDDDELADEDRAEILRLLGEHEE